MFLIIKTVFMKFKVVLFVQMKIILSSTIAIIIGLNSVAQNSISNSIWFGHTDIPISADIQLVFKKDSLFILSDDGRTMGESMTYLLRNDSLYIQKISGRTPCTNGT